VEVACPTGTLGSGEEMTCTATGTSVIDQYANVGTVTGTDVEGIELTDDDPSHYFGTVSAIGLQKLANGDDANQPPGITVPAGSNVTMTFIVTNPGNVPIKNVVVTDDRGLTTAFIGGDANANVELDPGEVWTYQATAGPAEGANLNNIGTVTGVDLLENPLTASDPANVITPGDPAPRPIPRTGAEAMPLIFIGLALLVSGGGLLLGRRRFLPRRPG
jgi:LPXTG-motif cell wall-anchored protein